MPLLNIVLVEPEIPQNTGNVVRTCAATGARLHLVGPMGFRIDDKKLKRAGLDYWRLLDIVLYESLSDFLQKTAGIFSISRRRRAARTRAYRIRAAATSCLERRRPACRKSCWRPTRSRACASP